VRADNDRRSLNEMRTGVLRNLDKPRMMILICDDVSQQLSEDRLVLTQYARSLYENRNTSLGDSEAVRELRQVQSLELPITS